MTGDFYEDDEPIEEVRAAFEEGEKGVTERPRDLNQRAWSIVVEAVSDVDVVAVFRENEIAAHRENTFVGNRIVDEPDLITGSVSVSQRV